MLDALYIWIATLLAPRWIAHAPRSRRHRAGLRQRLGLVPAMPDNRFRLWIHCASVGEAAIPARLVERISEICPDTEIVFSSCTDTGVDRLRELYPNSAAFFLPCDLSPCVNAAMKRINPGALLLVEQEIWPNLLLACRRSRVPVAVINGRMNKNSSSLVRSLFRLVPGAKDAIKLCCTRSEVDAERFEYAGLDRKKIVNTGPLKYEALRTSVPENSVNELKDRFNISHGDRVIVAGSTHDGEEEALVQIMNRLKNTHPDIKLIIAPRHIERTDRIAAALQKKGCRVERMTELEKEDRQAGAEAVILIDKIGRLTDCYALATAVFVGRSLFEPGGGQNMMEPAALGKPVLTGPHTGNFKPEMEVLTAAKAVKTVKNEAELEQAISNLLSDEEYAVQLGKRAKETVSANRGATDRTVKELMRGIARINNVDCCNQNGIETPA